MSGPIAPLIADARTLEALIEENRLLRETIEYSPLPYAVYDANDHLVACNDAYKRIHPEAEFVKAARVGGPQIKYQDLVRQQLEYQVPPEDLEEAIADRVRAHRAADGLPKERFYSGLGWFRVTKYATPSGAIAGIAVEVNELKARQEELARARDNAEQNQLRQAEFLAHMSHELRTPLNGVLGLADLLLHSDLDDRQRMMARTIASSGENLLRIIGDVLEFSKLQAGAMELQSAPFDPLEIVREVVTLTTPQAAQKGLELTLHRRDQPHPHLVGDSGRLRQIVTNLVGNAIKFTETGKVDVFLATSIRSSTVQLEIEVRDTGIGIAEDQQDRIFDRFVQTGAARAREQGTGLGLSITRALVALMGGKISVSSIPGEGATFAFRLPLKSAP